MRAETATDFFEWTDHLVLAPGEETALRETGFVPDPQAETPNGETAYEHPRATLPRVLLRRGNEREPFPPGLASGVGGGLHGLPQPVRRTGRRPLLTLSPRRSGRRRRDTTGGGRAPGLPRLRARPAQAR